MLGAMMFLSKIIMEALPNIHLLGMFVMTFTVVFRKRALIPVYIYVFLHGLYYGFNVWWVPYLYVWTVLWAVTMLLPQNMPKKAAFIVYPAVCCIHGLAFGTLYSLLFCPLMGMNFEGMLGWIAQGLYFDVIHAAGNLILGTLVYPFSQLLKKLYDRYGIKERK